MQGCSSLLQRQSILFIPRHTSVGSRCVFHLKLLRRASVTPQRHENNKIQTSSTLPKARHSINTQQLRLWSSFTSSRVSSGKISFYTFGTAILFFKTLHSLHSNNNHHTNGIWPNIGGGVSFTLGRSVTSSLLMQWYVSFRCWLHEAFRDTTKTPRKSRASNQATKVEIMCCMYHQQEKERMMHTTRLAIS